MDSRLPSESLPAPDGLIAVERIEFDQPRPSVRPFTGNQGRAAPTEAIENEIATPRTIADGIDHKRDWLLPLDALRASQADPIQMCLHLHKSKR